MQIKKRYYTYLLQIFGMAAVPKFNSNRLRSLKDYIMSTFICFPWFDFFFIIDFKQWTFFKRNSAHDWRKQLSNNHNALIQPTLALPQYIRHQTPNRLGVNKIRKRGYDEQCMFNKSPKDYEKQIYFHCLAVGSMKIYKGAVKPWSTGYAEPWMHLTNIGNEATISHNLLK